MEIRRLASNEVELHRTVRLRALKDSPYSFAETFEVALRRPKSTWQEQTDAVTLPNRHVMFLAEQGKDIHGSVYGLLSRERDDGIRVGGMWVDPSRRSCGLGQRLLDAVLTWGQEQGRPHTGLWVPIDQAPAIKLYSRSGFVTTGEVKAFPDKPGKEIMAMERRP